MDAHIGKPIQIAQLLEAMIDALGPNARAEGRAA